MPDEQIVFECQNSNPRSRSYAMTRYVGGFKEGALHGRGVYEEQDGRKFVTTA